MGLGGILQELKTEGVLALYHDYRSGRLVDYSGNGRSGVATNTSFSHRGAVLAPTTGVITVTYDAGLTATSISLIAGLRFPRLIDGDRIASRRNVGTTFDWYYSAGQIYIFDGVSTRVITPTGDIITHGVSMTTAGTPIGYFNGVSAGNYSGSVLLTATTNNLNIGLFSTNLTHKLYRYFVYVTRALTATEHARVYGQLENMRWNTKGLTPGPMMP